MINNIIKSFCVFLTLTTVFIKVLFSYPDHPQYKNSYSQAETLRCQYNTYLNIITVTLIYDHFL